MLRYMIRAGLGSFFLLSFFLVSTCFAAYEISDGSVKGLWHVNGDSTDASGNGNNGSDTNVSYVTGLLNKAASFSGNGHINVADNSSLHFGSGNRSYSLWLKTSSNAGNQNLTGNRNDNTTWWRILTADATHFYLEMGNSFPTNYKLSTSNAVTYADGNWHLLQVVVSGGNILWYFDGAAAGTDTWSAFSTDNANGEIQLGSSHHSGYTDFLTGSLDEVFFTNSALSTTTISNVYNAGLGIEICTVVGCGATGTIAIVMSTTTDAIVGNVFQMTFVLQIFALFLCVAYVVYRISRK